MISKNMEILLGHFRISKYGKVILDVIVCNRGSFAGQAAWKNKINKPNVHAQRKKNGRNYKYALFSEHLFTFSIDTCLIKF